MTAAKITFQDIIYYNAICKEAFFLSETLSLCLVDLSVSL